MGKGFWEHMVADSTSWVQDSNERLKEYLEGSLSKADLESFVTVMPRRDGYRIYAGEKPDAPFAYVDVYLDGNALVVEGSSKRHLSEQEMGDLARFLGISGSEAGEKLNRFRKFIDALQKHAGEDVDKADKGQKIGEAAPKATVSDDLGASADVYLAHDGDMSFDDAAAIISSFNTDYSLEDGLLWVSEKWVDPSDSATEVNLSLAVGILGIANGDDIVASDLYDSLSDDEVYDTLAIKDLVVQVYTSDHREYHEFIYKDPSHELLRKVVRTVLFFSEARDNYKDTYEGLKKILPAAQISDSVSVNFKNSKGGSVVRQISGERVGKPVGKARPVRDSKASEVAKIDKALDLVRNAYKSTGKKSEVKGMSLDIKGLDDAVVDLKAYKSGKEDKIAVEIRWKDGERKGFDYGIDAKASHVYGDIVSLKKVADSLEDPTEDLIGIAKEGDITYAEVESIFSSNGVKPSLDDRVLWVNYDWDDSADSKDEVHLALSSGLYSIHKDEVYARMYALPYNQFMQDVKVDYALVQVSLTSKSTGADSEYKEFLYENPSKSTLDRISRVVKAVSIVASSYEGTVQLLEASLPKEGRVSDSVHVDIKNRKGGAAVRQIDGSHIGKPVGKACPVRDSKFVGQKIGKATPKATVSDDFAKSTVADAVEGSLAPQTKVRIQSLLTTDPYGHSGDAGVVLGRLDVDPNTVVVSFASGAPIALYDIDAIELDAASAKTQDAAPASIAKLKEVLVHFIPEALSVSGEPALDLSTMSITEEKDGRIVVHFEGDLGDEAASVLDWAIARVGRSLGYTPSSAEVDAYGATYMLSPLHVSDSDEVFGVYNLKERRWFLAPDDPRGARWGFEDAAKRYASKEDAEAALNEVAELQPGTAKSAFVVKPLGRVSDSEKRSDFVFPADSSDVNDGKGHFPLNSLRRARAAIAYANKYRELPTWYSGDLDLKGFVDKIVSEVKKQYPSIEISTESYIPAPDQK